MMAFIHQYLELIFSIFLFVVGLYLIFGRVSQVEEQKDLSGYSDAAETSGLAESKENFDHTKDSQNALHGQIINVVNVNAPRSAGIAFSTGAAVQLIPILLSHLSPVSPSHLDVPAVYKGPDAALASAEPSALVNSTPSEFRSYLNRGLIHELEKQPDLAFDSYRQALAQRPVTLGEAAQAMSRLAQIRLDQGYPGEAVLLARIAVDLEGENALYRNTLARVLITQCQFDEAKNELDRIVDDNPATKELRQALDGTHQKNCTES